MRSRDQKLEMQALRPLLRPAESESRMLTASQVIHTHLKFKKHCSTRGPAQWKYNLSHECRFEFSSSRIKNVKRKAVCGLPSPPPKCQFQEHRVTPSLKQYQVRAKYHHMFVKRKKVVFYVGREESSTMRLDRCGQLNHGPAEQSWARDWSRSHL